MFDIRRAAHGTGSCSVGRKNLAALSLVRIVIGVEGVARFKVLCFLNAQLLFCGQL